MQGLTAKETPRRRLATIVFAIITVALIGVVLTMAGAVRTELSQLKTASTDNVQWMFSQSEIELLRFEAALSNLDEGKPDALSTVRKSFDIFYSRINILEASPIFAALPNDPRFENGLESARSFLITAAPVLDGSDQGLLEAKPQLLTEARILRRDLHEMSLVGVAHFAELSDFQRSEFSKALMRTALMAGLLFALLLILAGILAYQYRMLVLRTRETDQTFSRLEAVMDSALDAVLVIDTAARITEFSKAAEAVFGYSREDVIGKDMAELIIPQHLRAAHVAGMKRYLETGERRVVGQGRVKLEAQHKDGHIFPVELSISSAPSENGEMFVAFLRDISDEVAAEKALTTARDEALAGERAKAEFLAVMSHEMRTPLNGLLGTLELLDETSLDQKQRELLSVAATSGKLLLHHVSDVLEISKLDAATEKAILKPFDVYGLVKGICGSQRSVADARKIELSIKDINLGNGLVVGDEMRLTQILLNILGNALKFAPGGQVSIECERLSGTDMVEFRVADTGIGIADEDQDRIFEDFVTLDPSYGRTASGTGLGLGITKRLVHTLGGDIGVESEPGEGSLFWVRVPLAPVNTRDQKTVSETPRPTAHEQPDALEILVVEDNAINRLVVGEMLQGDGHKVHEARNGEEGIALAEQLPFDLIFMDISMPIMDGVQATQRIRAQSGKSGRVPIVALTANALPEDVARFREAGMLDVLVKPVTRESLRRVLRSVSGQIWWERLVSERYINP